MVDDDLAADLAFGEPQELLGGLHSLLLRDDLVEHLLRQRGAGHGNLQLVGEFQAELAVPAEHFARMPAPLLRNDDGNSVR